MMIPVASLRQFILLGALAISASAASAPPPDPDLSQGTAFAEEYRKQFVSCDGLAPGAVGKDKFRGVSLYRPGVPATRQYYLCSRDPSHVEALVRMPDGAIAWRSKMALDVDGSWAAWNGLPGATDLKNTSYRWRNVTDRESRAAQVDPDRFPFIVMPMAGLRILSGSRAPQLGAEFHDKTGIGLGDMGVVFYRGAWTPVFVADGGPFMRLGEGSSRVFENLGQSRCRQWSADGSYCAGTGGYPYRNFGIGSGVTFIVYPGSAQSDITAQNAMGRLCTFAKDKLGLTGGACPA